MDIVSYLIGYQAGQNASSGGSSDDVRYVTFMSYDGTVEYGRIPVAIGYDCPNPKFDTPTRESSVQYNYTFAGWATVANGGLDDNALKSVTEDRTVYANFMGSLRVYTATFYDGDTIMGTSKAAYGTQATPPDTTKAGFTFVGWAPSNLTLYGDTDFVGNWESMGAYIHVASITPTTTNAYDVAITNAGTKVAIGSSAPLEMFDISGETPVQTISDASGVKHRIPRFSTDDAEVYILGNLSNMPVSTKLWKHNAETLAQTSVENIVSTQGSSLSVYAMEWLNNKHYFRSYNEKPSSGGTKYTSELYYYNGSANTKLSCGDATYANDAAFSPDGKMGAMGLNDGNVPVVKLTPQINNGVKAELLHTISAGSAVNGVSFSADGSKIAISTMSAPYVAIYNATTGAMICDLSEFITASSVAMFTPGTNDLLVGTGATVRLFDVSGNTAQESIGIPEYSGGTVKKIRSNYNGTRVVILSSTTAEVWQKNG